MEIFKHGGNLTRLSRISGRREDEILDFSANINPLGPPEWFRSVVSASLSKVIHYPDPDCTELVEAIAERYQALPQQIVAGNGSAEILHLVPRSLNARRAVIPVPSYADYASSSTTAGLEVETLTLQEKEGFRLDLSSLAERLAGDEVVFLCQPNNPTGSLFDADKLRRVAFEHPSTVFVVDEAFGSFVHAMDSLTKDRPENVVVVLSLTKTYAIPGLRLGCAIANQAIIERLRNIQPCWSVNSIAQAVGVAALKDTGYVRRSQQFIMEQRETLVTQLKSIPQLTVFLGEANFLLLRIDRDDLDARTLSDRMLVNGIAIRVCDNFVGLDRRFCRVAIRTSEENHKLCESLKSAMGIARSARRKARTPALMFQGCSSNAGKSVLTAAMGRILLQDGYHVAPFKAQNMSLNSFVTRSGDEMGRAQVVQAQACRLDPDVRMNPILLKPNTDTGSQVIVMGKPVGNMDVMEYVQYKPKAFEAAKEAYDSLARDFQVMVLEGAGSPAEVNLKHHDIVNMQMAQYAGAPVLLVGDIDRGGVFASFIGTMELLAEWERVLTAGFVINRFRGNKDLLHEAIEYTLRHTGRPVFGVVPHFPDLGLPEEDSVSFKAGLFDESAEDEDCVEIAVVDLPHISNFTDFDALRGEQDVRLKIVRSADDLNRPDAVILPGSKNVIGDLEYLKDRGIVSKLQELAHSKDAEIVGICGGFQMIGSAIADPHGLESDHKAIPALGFLNVTTVLALEKTLTRVTAKHLESGLTVHGYEIHHGQSDSSDLKPLVKKEDGSMDGCSSPEGRIWGTYLHGIFDADEFRRWFIDRLRDRRGLPMKNKVCSRYDLEPALDRLADAVRRSLDMDRIYKLMGIA
ncbi:MAG TPA: cobyric acid synthase [Desulfomonilaceae bacterium]|nr:cobyric acid synthase [Desulfomonilaceae bacterium]